jgi:hypothetical protein
MDTPKRIPKSPELKNGEDFGFLRDEGLQLIQQFSGEFWTDHNLHDPGITVLEAFCYALTELSLKANLDIKDILASGQQNENQALFNPEEILPAHPTTLTDYKKLLIDTEGVRNGWFIPLPSWEINDINGLYDVMLELDDDEELGDINRSIIERSFTIDFGGGDIRSYIIEVSFPFWDEEDVIPFQEEVAISSIVSPGLAGIELSTASPEDQSDYFAELEVTYNGALTTTFSITIRVIPEIGADAVENTAVENEIITLLSEAPGGGSADESILTNFNRKVAAAAVIEEGVWEKLRAHRNLGEDIRNISAVRIQEIGLNVKIDLLKSMNVEKFLADVLFELEIFFKPIIQFFTLADLEADMLSYEHIFDGPLLNNGFLNDVLLSDLPRGAADSRNSTVYVSDLLDLLMNIAFRNTATAPSAIENQVIAIFSISISNYIRNIPVVQKAPDCLILAKPEVFKPRFSFNKSNIQFYRNGLEIDYNFDLVTLLLEELRIAAQTENSISNSPLLPVGESLPIADFHSIQHDFPSVYGLGQNVLSESYPVEKRAKTEQFRAYLTLLDQLLASYSSQLFYVNELFSTDPDVTNSYFKNPLYKIPYYERLLTHFLGSTDSWENFQNDTANDYQQALDAIFESTVVFLDRRNRFLDHLIARFGTSLESYITFRYEETTLVVSDSGVINYSEELNLRQQEIAHDLILDKINYLRLLPELSKDRFKAFNYSDTAWDTINTSGLSKRLLTALGLRNLNRRTLYNEVNNFIQVNAAGPDFTFDILNSDANPMLTSVDNYPSAELAENAARDLIRQGISRDNYYLESQVIPMGTHLIGVQADPTALPSFLATAPPPIESEEFEARIVIRHIIRELKEVGSGAYIVEHILLRPDPDELSPLFLEIPLDDTALVNNPYSMRITIILPSGFERDFTVDADPVPGIPAQFQDEKFRSYVQRQIREETPAHIVAATYWLDSNTAVDDSDTPSLNNFTERWRAWLEAREDPATPSGVMETRRAELITVLNTIYQPPS